MRKGRASGNQGHQEQAVKIVHFGKGKPRKSHIKADLEIEVDDKWLQDRWEEEPVEDEEADALKVAIGTFQDAVNPAKLGKLFDAVQIRLKDWSTVAE